MNASHTCIQVAVLIRNLHIYGPDSPFLTPTLCPDPDNFLAPNPKTPFAMGGGGDTPRGSCIPPFPSCKISFQENVFLGIETLDFQAKKSRIRGQAFLSISCLVRRPPVHVGRHVVNLTTATLFTISSQRCNTGRRSGKKFPTLAQMLIFLGTNRAQTLKLLSQK